MADAKPDICKHAASCPMYASLKKKSMREFWINLYCNADFSRCARYKAAVEGKTVPPTLLPNGKDLAPYVLKSAGG